MSHLSRGATRSEALVQKIVKRRADVLIEALSRITLPDYLAATYRGAPQAKIHRKSLKSIKRRVLRELDLRPFIDALCDHVPEVVKAYPPVTRRDFVAILKLAWPASRGPGANRIFDAGLIRAAHAALLQEHPHWGSRAATKELADHLMVTPRTIQAHLRISKKK